MPRFVLIDHSIQDEGSHHFEYARVILRAAEAKGFEILVGSNRRLQQPNRLPDHWRVFPVFEHNTYSRYSVLRPGHRPARPVRGWWSTDAPGSLAAGVVQSWNRHRQQRRIRSFVESCEALFREVDLEAGDQVFLPTLSDLDLVSAIEFLAENPATRVADWHLQFQFKFLDGRPPEYAAQADTVRRLGEHFRAALARVPEHKIRLYCTTEELVDQFDRLDAGRFEFLPYPTDTERPKAGGDPARRPLRLTCAGGLRAEKGQDQLARIAQPLWASHFATGQLQLRVQARDGAFSLELAEGQSTEPSGLWPTRKDGPLLVAPHPLPVAEYEAFLGSTDIGLFLYDSRAYYGRAAGILIEMLAAGVPVVVPAGSWLGEQIAEAEQQHLIALREATPHLEWLGPEDFPWTPSNQAGTAEAELAVPEGEPSDLWVGLHWAGEPGSYVNLSAVQRGENEEELGRSRAVLGTRHGSAPAATLIPLTEGARHVELRVQDAFQATGVSLDHAEACFLAPPAAGGHHPRSAVGCLAADPEQIPGLLSELCAQYAHYRSTAESFAAEYRALHDPQHLLGILLGS